MGADDNGYIKGAHINKLDKKVLKYCDCIIDLWYSAPTSAEPAAAAYSMSVRVSYFSCLYLDEVPAAVTYTITTLLNTGLIRCRTYQCRRGFVQIPTSVYKT